MADSVEESILKAAEEAERERDDHMLVLIKIYMDAYASGYATALFENTEHDLDSAAERANRATDELQRYPQSRAAVLGNIARRVNGTETDEDLVKVIKVRTDG